MKKKGVVFSVLSILLVCFFTFGCGVKSETSVSPIYHQDVEEFVSVKLENKGLGYEIAERSESTIVFIVTGYTDLVENVWFSINDIIAEFEFNSVVPALNENYFIDDFVSLTYLF